MTAQAGGARAAGYRVNPADVTGRTAKGKNQLRWVHGDIVIATVGRFQTILALQSHGTATDQGTLHPSLATARANLDAAGIHQRIRVSLADAGFISQNTLDTPTEGIPLIAVSRPDQDDKWHPRSDTPQYQRMTARLANPAGTKLYHRRMGMIEPVFQHLTQHGGRNLHYRSPARATELTIMAIAYNTAKLTTRCHALNTTPTTSPPTLKTLTIRNRNTTPPRN